jgi:hypothetical protein
MVAISLYRTDPAAQQHAMGTWHSVMSHLFYSDLRLSAKAQPDEERKSFI